MYLYNCVTSMSPLSEMVGELKVQYYLSYLFINIAILHLITSFLCVTCATCGVTKIHQLKVSNLVNLRDAFK